MAATGKNSGLNIGEAWSKLLIANEKAAKKNKLTDDKLIEAMQKDFPDRADKTTITRLPRGIYNKGTSTFAPFGPSGTKDRPRSFQYNAEGEQIARKPRSDAGTPKVAKAGKGKPKVAKQNLKQVSKTKAGKAKATAKTAKTGKATTAKAGKPVRKKVVKRAAKKAAPTPATETASAE